MHREEILTANIENLIAFWTACGIQEHSLSGRGTLYSSVSWPHRVWFDYVHQPSRQDLEQLVTRAEAASVPVKIPRWHEQDEAMHEALVESGFEISMNQELMAMSITHREAHPASALPLRQVNGGESTCRWTEIASESFGYAIDELAISRLVGAPGFYLLVAYVDDTAVGTGMLLRTGTTAGLHMVGVPPAQRRRGYARQITFGLLELARELGCEHATLQASGAGGSLYRQLGFEGQGTLQSYSRKPSR